MPTLNHLVDCAPNQPGNGYVITYSEGPQFPVRFIVKADRKTGGFPCPFWACHEWCIVHHITAVKGNFTAHSKP